MHNVELMAALIVASTALAGLQTVALGQTLHSKSMPREIKVALRVVTAIAFILAISTLYGAVNWLDNEGHEYLSIAKWSFSIQLFMFVPIISTLVVQATKE